MRCVIIGAGPTGLGAAYQLEKLGVPWRLFEAETEPGGLAASFQKDGFTWDLGGHVLFSHYDCFDRMISEITAENDWLSHERRAYVRILDRWVPYPFQNNIHYLPAKERDVCLAGLQDARAAAGAPPPANFEEWILRSVGTGIADLFLLPYNTKVWACPPRVLATQWLGERVAVPDVDKLLRSMKNEEILDDWGPNRTFRFPVHGGTGVLWRRLAATLPADNVRYGYGLVEVDCGKRTAKFSNGHEEQYDCLISSIPLDLLAEMTCLPGRDQVSGLRRNSVCVVGIGVRGNLPEHALSKTWLYFPEFDYPFYRVTVFSNYSSFNAPDGCCSLMAEVAVSPEHVPDEGALISRCVDGLKRAELMNQDDAVVHTWFRRIPYAYPVPHLGRDEILGSILPELDELGVYSRGRFGAWKYEVGNMDHSFAQGVEAANHVVTGEPEITIHDPDLVNTPKS